MMCVAGAPLDLTLKRRMEDEFGIPLLNGYGITECSPGLAGVRQTRPCWGRKPWGPCSRASNTGSSTGTETGWPMARSVNCMSAVST
jgi:acyl-CoA synthetase (AMP-forming)/AMP-acid ligase II